MIDFSDICELKDNQVVKVSMMTDGDSFIEMFYNDICVLRISITTGLVYQPYISPNDIASLIASGVPVTGESIIYNEG